MNYFRKKLKAFPLGEWLETGLVLCFVGGFLDAYTYLTRGGVFANAQTGNIILLAIGLARGEGVIALRFLVPVAVFVAGVFLSQLFLLPVGKKRSGFRAHGFILSLEIAVLVGAGLLPASFPDEVVTVLVSFAAALQFDNFRKLEGRPFATAFCTGNLRSATEHFFRATVKRERGAARSSLDYLLAILAFVGGVFGGYFATAATGTYSALIAAAILLLILLFLLIGDVLRNRLLRVSVRKLSDGELENARALVFESFSRFVAPDYTEEGINAFRAFLYNEALPETADFFGVFERSDLQGALIADKDGRHIRAFFVRAGEQGKGFGGALMQHFLATAQSPVTVNASRYGKPIYEKLGFAATGGELQKDGMIFTPMVYEK